MAGLRLRIELANERYFALYAVAVGTGMRLGELEGIVGDEGGYTAEASPFLKQLRAGGYKGILVGGDVGPYPERRRAHRSVSFSSMRRLRR